ncbi:carbohydrate ABC transporter substrate-binding protein, CUT1 family [Anaerovirgula multivorans]|uniref:Carbohydrate ABC transporter substrate-binding protein, CUT1 family n=1 Tax=Anaerovirgula multivorans TaxID=312168 RepID=A0A239BGJ8_9FIRM|nr:ABC transporter substrate-binding protein [Anaerovirgula multivorans]SNS06571.1 carbohydrate ABC transporter substrate-binding protein, CUT1 family [Anaerovirgula multivorans]
MKKLLALFLVLVLTTTTLMACREDSSQEASSGDRVDISILLSKPEIARQFEETIEAFTKENPNIRISLVPLAGQNAYEKMTALYSSGNAATIMMMGQEFDPFKDRLLDVSDQPWVKNALSGTTDFVTIDGKIYGMPVTVEAFAYIYNKKAIEEAIGGSFDYKSIRTGDDLKKLFDKLASADKMEAIHVSPMDWSLGAHLSNVFFTAQSSNRNDRHQFMQDLKDGKVSLADNDVFNGWLDTFDLMKEYNNAKGGPLGPQYDDGPIALARGEVGLWFMGNWAYPQIHEIDPEGEYGFIPVPISNDANDYGNSHLSVGVPSYWTIDESQSTKEQQEAANKFLNWLVSSETGQKYYVEKLNLIPVFDNFEIKPEDSLSLSILEYMEADKSMEWMNTYYPADGWPTMGASLQKYLGGQINRDELTSEIENYWKNAE